MQTCTEKETSASYVMTLDNISEYLQYEQDNGASDVALRQYRHFTKALYVWLPEGKTITKEVLQSWRHSLQAHGYSAYTELNYIKGINRYLDYMGWSDLRFNRGKAKDIAGQQFGYLTAIEPTGAKNRKDFIWRCKCKCGKEVEYPATRLLTGNTLSCGCILVEQLKAANKYVDGTSLRQSLEEQVSSTRAISGYTGVRIKRNKWQAYIKYKGKDISIGCYTRLEDAIKARARGKELVQEDAKGLLDFYEELHKDDPPRPNRAQVKQAHKEPKSEMRVSSGTRAIRSNNTSGCSGVFQKRDKWAARITYEKVTYHLGVFDDLDSAVAARKAAEQQLLKDPANFPKWVSSRRNEVGTK